MEIIEYGDLACPACREASTTTIPEAIDQIVKPGDAKLVFRPIAFISRSSERGALGAEAAGMQDAMWSFVELIYRNQGPESDQDWLTDDLMTDAVEQLGLDVDQWTADYMGQESEQKFLATDAGAGGRGRRDAHLPDPGPERREDRHGRRRGVRAPGRRGRGGSPDLSGAWPGETALRIAIGVVAIAGLGVSGYLTAVRYSGDPACVVGGGCTTVQESEYSELVGIPVAVLGLVAYAACSSRPSCPARWAGRSASSRRWSASASRPG